MREPDLFTLRPRLTNRGHLARALASLGEDTPSKTEIWRRLTDSFAVDLDAVAAMLPRGEAEPLWLSHRD